MNYLTEIREFYDWLELNPLSSSAINLWHALMHINNKAKWIEEFTVSINTLELKTGLKRSSIYRARNQLKQYGRIDFKERNSNLSSVYRVFPFGTQSGTQDGTQNGTQDGTQNGTINKQNKTKQNEIKKNVFKKPTLEEIRDYCIERKNNVDAEKFYDFYESKGWFVGKNPMKDWKASVRTWEKEKFKTSHKPTNAYRNSTQKEFENLDAFYAN